MGNRSVLPGKFTNGMLSLYHDKVKKPRRIKKSSLPESRLRKNHRERYSSDSTGSSHSVAVSSPGISTGTCENQPSRAAPCRCLTFGGMTTTWPASVRRDPCLPPGTSRARRFVFSLVPPVPTEFEPCRPVSRSCASIRRSRMPLFNRPPCPRHMAAKIFSAPIRVSSGGCPPRPAAMAPERYRRPCSRSACTFTGSPQRLMKPAACA